MQIIHDFLLIILFYQNKLSFFFNLFQKINLMIKETNFKIIFTPYIL